MVNQNSKSKVCIPIPRQNWELAIGSGLLYYIGICKSLFLACLVQETSQGNFYKLKPLWGVRPKLTIKSETTKKWYYQNQNILKTKQKYEGLISITTSTTSIDRQQLHDSTITVDRLLCLMNAKYNFKFLVFNLFSCVSYSVVRKTKTKIKC